MNVKRVFNLGMALMMLITSFAVSQPVAAQAPAMVKPNIQADAEAVPGEVVVVFADSQDMNLVEKIEQAVETANTADGEVTRLSMDGSAVIQVEGDVAAATAELSGQPDVLYAEPNYIFSVPENEGDPNEVATSEFVLQPVAPNAGTDGQSVMAVPSSTIQEMVAMGTYPTDKYLNGNPGWFAMGADIVWPNKTASANICVIDTGVDSKHPDLAGKIVAGYDFVDADLIPSDANGHGTHVAGIMVALSNNALGISGVSTGKAVAVRALDAQGVGTAFDVATAIKYCADRTDIRVINLSVGGTADSASIRDALLYAVTPTTQTVSTGTFLGLKGRGKLVVAAAGNGSGTTPTYPAGYSVNPLFTAGSILSVGSTGQFIVDDDPNTTILEGYNDYGCLAQSSNRNADTITQWVNVVAPGEKIYSTTPYDIPFYKNLYEYTNTRYDYMSGTSMAAAFVSASAARRMGYKPTETNVQVGNAVMDTGDPLTDVSCNPSQHLNTILKVNVASLMDRTAVRVSVWDAHAGTPLNGAAVGVYFTMAGVTSSRVSTISPQTTKGAATGDIDPNRVFSYYQPAADILDIPVRDAAGNAITNHVIKVSRSGYTVGYQPIFQQERLDELYMHPGTLNVFVNGAVPPLSTSFDVAMGWHVRTPVDAGHTKYPGGVQDLDLYVWLPGTPYVDGSQTDRFVVGYGGDPFNAGVADSYGSLTNFPYARFRREGGFTDGGPLVETTTILKRAAHGTVLANAKLPYWAGAYTVFATDYGQTFDHDNDGCGDNYGYFFSDTYNPASDSDCPPNDAGGTLGVPLLGAYFTPYVYVWKDGVVKYFLDGSNNFGAYPIPDACNTHWWKAFAISSPLVGISTTLPTYTTFDQCGDETVPGFVPYGIVPSHADDQINLFGMGK
jgi:thermitase